MNFIPSCFLCIYTFFTETLDFSARLGDGLQWRLPPDGRCRKRLHGHPRGPGGRVWRLCRHRGAWSQWPPRRAVHPSAEPCGPPQGAADTHRTAASHSGCELSDALHAHSRAVRAVGSCQNTRSGPGARQADAVPRARWAIPRAAVSSVWP